MMSDVSSKTAEEDVILCDGPCDGVIYRLKVTTPVLYLPVWNPEYKVEPDGPSFRFNRRTNEWESVIPPLLQVRYTRAEGETDAKGFPVFRYEA